MSDTFFSDCSFKNTEIKESKFVRTEFFQTCLAGLDFSNSILQNIIMSDNAKELSGAKVNSYQAAELSKLLGLIVVD